MLQANTPDCQGKNNWQSALAKNIRDPHELLSLLNLPLSMLPKARKACRLFPLRVTHSFLSRMEKGNKNDPLLRQVLPLGEECEQYPGYIDDPLNEASATISPGLLKKYHGRALLITTSTCAINCRYCFRRNFPYADSNSNSLHLDTSIATIRKDTSINEIILSGGDPLVMSTHKLRLLIDQLANIPHIKRVRFHSRLPIVLPERITDNLLALFSNPILQMVMVIHCNHPQEINDDVANALNKLHLTGAPILNQAVLLRGVNDNATILTELSEKLFSHHVIPYYLHCLDKTSGTAHFNVDDNEITQIIEHLQSSLPGYLVPKLVKEVAGANSKTLW